MLRNYRSRGRPRTRQTAPDQGTIELQQHRDAKRNLLPHPLEATAQDIHAYLEGSHLHAFYLMGWISQEIFLSALAYAKLMHRAFRSMGLRSTLKSYLLPKHERGIYQPAEDRRTETLWREISGQLKAFFRPRHYQLLMRLMAMTNSSLPAREDVRFVLSRLHDVMRGKITFPS